MTGLEENLKLLALSGSSGVTQWIKANKAHGIVARLIRKGRTFMWSPFKEAKKDGVFIADAGDRLMQSFRAILRLMSTSYDLKKELFECDQKDIFYEYDAQRALFAVFMRKGWSNHVWDPEIVGYSSFRAAVGMAITIHALYIHDSMVCGDFDRAVSQCADAHELLMLHMEKKETMRRRQERESIRQIKSKGGRARHKEKSEDKMRAKEYWERWQRDPVLYRSQREFADDMIEKFGVDAGGTLTSASTITNKWIPEWRGAAGNQA
ncbi:hypothetical protein [Burkholderia gladioli]|uniref:hypothetical protein n=1 Tax=Burkholderia gladioli TaxID=28095 RepID=UPI00163FBBC1|nr:hypothetical protein [Burkholderia gladioli]